jgi:hypothetical protein
MYFQKLDVLDGVEFVSFIAIYNSLFVYTELPATYVVFVLYITGRVISFHTN